MQYRIVCFIFLMSSCISVAQEFNALDSEGKRHGKWKKKYEGTNQLRYEGTFDHGKEVGTFKFYKQDSGKNPTATKLFSKNSDTVRVKYFNSKGGVISEGSMKGKQRTGTWTYYHKNSSKVMMTEEYQSGNLHGAQLTYFENGQLTEKAVYVNGKKEGKRIIYAEGGTILKEYTYSNDLLHGSTKYYDAKGVLEIEGNYKKNRKDGVWKYYKNGKLSEEKTFPLQKRGS